MATLNGNYVLPTRIRWSKSGTDTLGINPSGEGGTRIAFASQYYTFQVQYRTRDRYSPSGLATAGLSPVDEWTDWGAWQDPENAERDDAKSSCSKNGNVITYTGHSFALSYDMSTYDAHEIQLRVRVFDEPSLTCSEWSYGTVRGVINPTGTAAATRNADGSFALEVSTNWVRPGAVLRIEDPRRCETNVRGESLGPYWSWLPWDKWAGVQTITNDGTGDAAVTVPGKVEQDGHLYFGTFNFTTADGGVANFSSLYYDGSCAADANRINGTPIPRIYDVEIGEHTEPAGIDEPTLTTTTENGSVVLDIDGGTWDGAAAWYTWKDARGQEHSGQIALKNDGEKWSGIIDAPPYDVAVSISVSVIENGEWVNRTTTVYVPSHGFITMQHGTAETVHIVYNHSDGVRRRFNNEIDIFKPAGTSRPKSRYGDGGTMTLTLSGLSPDVVPKFEGLERQGVAKFAELEVAGDWLLRIPGGERYTVALKSYALENTKTPDVFSITMNVEVVS